MVGLPLRSNGEDSETTRQARNMAARLARRTDLPVYLMPELLSSHEAESRLRQAGTVQGDLRLVDMAALPDVQLTDAEALEDDDAQE